LQKDFSAFSACTPPNMQTIIMQVLLSSAHVNNSRISQTKPSHYLSLREDRFSTELRECFWNAGGAECSNEPEGDCLLGGYEITSSWQTSDLSKCFPSVDFACKKTHQIFWKFVIKTWKLYILIFIFQNETLKVAHTRRNICLLGKEQGPSFHRKEPWFKLNQQVSEDSVGIWHTILWQSLV